MAADSNVQLRDRLLERPIVPLPIPATSTSKQLTSRPVLLVGWSLRESTGSAAAVAELLSGHGAGGSIVGEQQLATGLSNSITMTDEGVLCEGGLFLNMVSGSVLGSVWVRV